MFAHNRPDAKAMPTGHILKSDSPGAEPGIIALFTFMTLTAKSDSHFEISRTGHCKELEFTIFSERNSVTRLSVCPSVYLWSVVCL